MNTDVWLLIAILIGALSLLALLSWFTSSRPGRKVSN